MAATAREQTFDELFSQAVDEAFSALGESAKQAIYWYVATKHGLQKQELGSHVEAFADALEAFFLTGSGVIEAMILQNLETRSGVSLKKEEHDAFVDSVKVVRHKVRARPRKPT
jgi:hypothetical protein